MRIARSLSLGFILFMILNSPGSPGSILIASNAPEFVWIGRDGKPLPFSSVEELEEFLRTARVLELDEIPVGINKPKKLTLVLNDISMHAIYRDVEVQKQKFVDAKGIRLNFRDMCIYECASYRLSKLLGITNVPPVVERTFVREDFEESKHFKKLESKEGVIQAWVEDSFTEKDRLKKKLRPPDLRRWSYQHQIMKVFDSLIFNDDRNQGNMLIGPDWKLWFIDATRAFRVYDELSEPERIKRCDRKVFENLKSLSDEDLDQGLGDLLRNDELKTLKARREVLVQLLEDLIAKQGEEAVLFNYY